MASSSDRYVRLMTVRDWMASGKQAQALHKLIEEKFELKSSSARNKLIKEAGNEIWGNVTQEELRHQYNTFIASIIDKSFSSKKYDTAIRAITAGIKLNKLDSEIHQYNNDNYVIEF